ncbi:MAG: phosphopantetheine adenylyltransferase [Candidatus Ranarchaeia archaeon]
MSKKTRKYSGIGVGGTFDRFHKGHKKLIEMALELGDMVLICVTTEKMLENHPKVHEVDSYSERVGMLTSFLEEKKCIDRAVIIPLDDSYGPTLSDASMDVIIVSLETAFRARAINRLRVNRGLKPLKIMVLNMVLAEDGTPISSNRIRRGEIDREGHLIL